MASLLISTTAVPRGLRARASRGLASSGRALSVIRPSRAGALAPKASLAAAAAATVAPASAMAADLGMQAIQHPAVENLVATIAFEADDGDILGIGSVAVACVVIGYVVWNGYRTIDETKAYLLEKGVETKGINRVGPLKYLKKVVDEDGDLDLAREWVNMQLAINAIQFGNGVEFNSWIKYYQERGIDVKYPSDLNKIKAYVAEKVAESEARKNQSG
eukprot:CAMPEP_0182866490 /NCGR_PEP_ID=MMETSP0034_2-20130328/8228_1 /TAXON_ID=156128 /ORGANISM="Nephroselmis pyriformis, Strain CCMP717" /LENGTH=217 /DNA_ID=CAMNT_0024998819 /DNA_START=34 /DNA_END=687 /DNA_ORIENTATION=-